MSARTIEGQVQPTPSGFQLVITLTSGRSTHTSGPAKLEATCMEDAKREAAVQIHTLARILGISHGRRSGSTA